MNMSSGYVGWSMSVRAAQAYEDGEAPMSKWNKDAIISGIAEVLYDNDVEDTAILMQFEQFPLWFLKDAFLEWSSWHHTSKYANVTDFYKVNEDNALQCAENPDTFVHKFNERKKIRRLTSALEKRGINRGEWIISEFVYLGLNEQLLFSGCTNRMLYKFACSKKAERYAAA